MWRLRSASHHSSSGWRDLTEELMKLTLTKDTFSLPPETVRGAIAKLWYFCLDYVTELAMHSDGASNTVPTKIILCWAGRDLAEFLEEDLH